MNLGIFEDIMALIKETSYFYKNLGEFFKIIRLNNINIIPQILLLNF
jgi:hypothetical protein